MSSLDRLRFARAYAAQQLPWFAPALFRARIIVSPAVDVAAVDRGYNVYFNPAVVDRIWETKERRTALSELGFLWVHEISHLLRDHADRARGDARRWNIACDFEINDSEWTGLQMPAAYPGMLPQDFGYARGLLAESYLNAMDAGANTFSEFGIDEGSGVHGRVRPWEEGDCQRISPVDEEIIRREVARRTREAAAEGIPEGWRKWAAEVLDSRIDWRTKLSHRLSVSLQRGLGSRTDYSYRRPSRRQSVYYPILPPVLSGGKTARIAIVVDTSASMGEVQLQRALAEVAAIVKQFHYPVTIIPCDIQAYEPVKITAAKEAFQLHDLPGGSGTRMTAGIESALHLRPPPDAILVLTDGMTDYPAELQSAAVIFGILTTEGEPTMLPPDPPFGSDRVVLI